MIGEREESDCSPKCIRRFYLSLAFLFIAGSLSIFMIVVMIVVIWFKGCPKCEKSLLATNESYFVTILGCVGTVLFVLGGSILIAFSWKKGQNNSYDDIPQALISLIPAEDLEKSPAAVLPYIHIPRDAAFEKKALVLDLPDYFTVVQTFDEFYSAMDHEDIWSVDVPEIPDTPPPCYTQALEMTLTAVAVELEEEIQKKNSAV